MPGTELARVIMADRNGTSVPRAAPAAKAKKNVTELLDRQPPACKEIERELLGALFLAGSEQAFEDLEQADFYQPWYGFMFSELKAAHKAKVPFRTEGALIDWLKRRGTLNRFRQRFGDGFAYTLTAGKPWGLVTSIPYYVQVIKEYRRRREAIAYSVEMLQLAHDDSTSVEAWLATAKERLGGLWPENNKHGSLQL